MSEFKKSEAALARNRQELWDLVRLGDEAPLARIDGLEAELKQRQTESSAFDRRATEQVLAPSGELVDRYGPEMKKRALAHVEAVRALLSEADASIPALRERALHWQSEQTPIVSTEIPVVPAVQPQPPQRLDPRRETEMRAEAIEQAVRTVRMQERDPLRDELARVAGMPRGLEAVKQARVALDAGGAAALRQILDAIVKRPEDDKLRTLKLSNLHVKALLDISGVVAFLTAVGFAPVSVGDDADEAGGGGGGNGTEVAYKLVEPDVSRDFEAWGAWFDLVKAASAALK